MLINSLADLLKDVRLMGSIQRDPSLPKSSGTPSPERNKVVANPVRVPINKQAAMILSPIHSWLSKPLPPERLPTHEASEIAELKAELRSERNAHALTRDNLGKVRGHLRQAKAIIMRLRTQVSELQCECQKKDCIIAQLEDLKL